MTTVADERVRKAEQLLQEEGLSARVEAEGPHAEIAAIRLADGEWDRWLQPGGTDLAARIRSLGFRYVALDLAAEAAPAE